MSDFNYLHTNCFEITVELGCVKFPPEEALYGLWQHNKEPLLNFLEMVSPTHWELPMVGMGSSSTLSLPRPRALSGALWKCLFMTSLTIHSGQGASQSLLLIHTMGWGMPGRCPSGKDLIHDETWLPKGAQGLAACGQIGWPASKPWRLPGSSR